MSGQSLFYQILKKLDTAKMFKQIWIITLTGEVYVGICTTDNNGTIYMNNNTYTVNPIMLTVH